MRKLLEKLILWLSCRLGTEAQMIPSLHTNVNKVVVGRMYEWYGRIVKAVANPNEVKTTYVIWPNKDMSTRAVDLICKNSDKLQISDKMYRTNDVALGEKLKQDGTVEVCEETTGVPCELCCMSQYGYPCPSCQYKFYWVQVGKFKQYCTDQNAYMRVMEKKINGSK